MRIRGPFLGFVVLAAVIAAMLAGCERNVDLGPVADARSVQAIRKVLATSQPAVGEKAAKPMGTGWATLRGQFVFDGDPPAMPPYNVDKERDVCTIAGKAPEQEYLKVDQGTKGIANVVIFLRDASRVHESKASNGGSVDFDQKVCVFLTHVLAVQVGQTVQIKNSDPIGHNTNIVGTGFNPTVPGGGSIPYPVRNENTQPYSVKCGIHPWMTAYLLQRKDGYFAVTDAQGRFEIANVPAGEPLEFQVWHEVGAAPANGLVGTTPDVPEIKWSPRGRIQVSLKQDEAKEIKVVVPPKAMRL
jgi:hypothetical protein